MEIEDNLQKKIDYTFLLYVHLACADGQIHSEESRIMEMLINELNINDITVNEMQKIIGQNDDMLSLDNTIENVLPQEYMNCLQILTTIAYSDGFCDVAEKEMINKIAKQWNIEQDDLEDFIDKAISIQKNLDISSISLDYKQNMSLVEKVISKADTILSGRFLKALSKISSEKMKEKIKSTQNKMLLNGPEYDKAIENCQAIAKEDIKYAKPALNDTLSELNILKSSLSENIKILSINLNKSEAKTAKKVVDFIEGMEETLEKEIYRKLQEIKNSLNKKERAMQFFTVSFIGKTKAGKSTLHAVITGEGEDAIGVGKQRTTRLNRVYEWKNIRIIDTPGIGAPGGRSDEEIAESIIDESDLICFVLNDNNQQETEFSFLKKLKAKAKPLVILLNVKGNLNQKKRLDRFLENNEKIFSIEDKKALGGHFDHIKRYAEQHYGNAYFDIIPVHLFAALLSFKEEHIDVKDKLFYASRLQNFLDSLKLTLIEDGAIRRSQTLLSSTVADIEPSLNWSMQKTEELRVLAKEISIQGDKSKKTIASFKKDSIKNIKLKLKKIFANLKESVEEFALENWEAKEDNLSNAWEYHVNNKVKIEESLNGAYQEVLTSYTNDIEELLIEIGNELSLTAEAIMPKSTLDEQDSSTSMKNFLKIGGGLIGVASAGAFYLGFGSVALANIWNPIGWGLLAVGILAGLFSGLFDSKAKKQQKAVNKISESLNKQIDEQEVVITKNLLEACTKSTTSIENDIVEYFNKMADSLTIIEAELCKSSINIKLISDKVNAAYAKRVVSWLENSKEPLSDKNIKKTIVSVKRRIGKEMIIETSMPIKTNKPQEKISNILQEKLILKQKGTSHETV